MDPSVDQLEIGCMDWYFVRESDDVRVPDDMEAPELLCEDAEPPLPNGWLKWEVPTPKSFKLPPNKKPSVTATEPTTEFKLGNSDAYQFLGGGPDYQLQNLFQSIEGTGNIEQMDETFWNSLLEEDSSDLEYPYQPIAVFLNMECSSTPVENGILLDSESIKKNSSCLSSSKYLKTSGYAEAMDDSSDDCYGKQDCPPLHFVPSDYGRMEDPLPADAHLEEESLEEAVLQEFKDTMLQLNQKTRICFRDALYRLAECSKQQHSAKHRSTEFLEEEASVASIQNRRSRLGNSSMKLESETNAIDRMIMNLLFQN